MNFETDYIEAYIDSVYRKHANDLKSNLETKGTIILYLEPLFLFLEEVMKEHKKLKGSDMESNRKDNQQKKAR